MIMGHKTIYPTPEMIIRYNEVVLRNIVVKKADKSEVLSYGAIEKVIFECKTNDGDIYDKAVCLLKGLVKRHPFVSGNRRTAFVAVNEFIKSNRGRFNVINSPEYARVMQGIRENYYSDMEIKEWIKNGEIRAFKR